MLEIIVDYFSGLCVDVFWEVGEDCFVCFVLHFFCLFFFVIYYLSREMVGNDGFDILVWKVDYDFNKCWMSDVIYAMEEAYNNPKIYLLYL